jgi:nicotinate phosphoribosyltransferase
MATETGRRTRLDPAVFRLPVERIRAGYYSDAYFNFTRQLLNELDHHPRVTMQVFQKQRSILGGIDEAIAVLKLCSDGWDQLEVHALHEGDEIAPMETVMTIEGDYALFAHLETVYLGCLARRSLIMRNVRQVVEAAHGKPILFFPARHDHWLVQTGDGWAAHVAGAIGVSTDAQASWWGGRGVGTVPHALIAAFGGDKLWGVRLDTSERMVDRALWDRMGDFKPTGVNIELARLVRDALDDAGHRRVQIVASGGFDATKIREFEDSGAPVDAYGVGSSLVRGENDFTADVVRLEGRPAAKAGRRFSPNSRLEPVD